MTYYKAFYFAEETVTWAFGPMLVKIVWHMTGNLSADERPREEVADW